MLVLDNNRLISASDDGDINIWNISEAAVERTLTSHNKGVNALKLIKRGDLVSGSKDKTIKIWNIQERTVRRTLNGHEGEVCTLVELKNGDLASGALDSTIKIWDVDTGEVKSTLKGHTKCINKLELLSNGDLVSSSSDKTIKIWDTESGAVKRTLNGHTKHVYALKVLGNGDLVSAAGSEFIVWDVETGVVKKEVKVNSCINSFLELGNGHLVIASNESIIVLEDLKKEYQNLEAIVKDPDNFIYEEIGELKRQVDLDREKSKIEIDKLADDLIQQLESYEKKFKAEYKAQIKYYSDLLELSKKQLVDYEKCLNMSSVSNEEKNIKNKESENIIIRLKTKIKELNDKLFSYLSIKYEPMKNNIKDFFGKLLIIKVSF